MAKWRFGINKTMSILVAKSHKNLLAKTHTFSSQSRNQTRTLHHTRSIKDLARVFCGKHYWQKLREIYLQKLMHFIESGFDSPTCQFFFKSPFFEGNNFFKLLYIFWWFFLVQNGWRAKRGCPPESLLKMNRLIWHGTINVPSKPLYYF